MSLLVPDELRYDPSRHWTEQGAFAKAYGPEMLQVSGVLGGSVHETIEQALDISSEPAARPVYQELHEFAELFSRPPGKGGRSKPVGLYPGHRDLPNKEEEAEFERLLAAWYYLNHRFTEQQREADDRLRTSSLRVAKDIYARHLRRLSWLPELELAAVGQAVVMLAEEIVPPQTLDEIRAINILRLHCVTSGTSRSRSTCLSSRSTHSKLWKKR